MSQSILALGVEIDDGEDIDYDEMKRTNVRKTDGENGRRECVLLYVV